MKSLFFAIAIVLTGNSIVAQVEDAEKAYRDALQKFQTEERALDSLQSVLRKQADEIEKLKRDGADRARIENLMAKSIAVTNSIRSTQTALEQAKQHLNTIREDLLDLYSGEIKSLESSGKLIDEGKILQLSEKRLLLMPFLESLTFDPEKVKTLTLDPSGDPLDLAVKRDYLRKALAEIIAARSEVQTTRRETEQVNRLRQKARTFLEDAGEQNAFNVFGASSSAGSSPLEEPHTLAFARSVVTVMHQLQVPSFQTGKWASPGITPQRYVELLKEAESVLDNYRKLLEKKLK